MNQPVVLIIALVQHLEVTKGHIADGHIKEAVGHLHLFKAGDGNGAVLIKLLGNAPGDGIQLHTVGVAPSHAVRNHADKVANTAGWFQDVALPEAHLLQCLIHGLDDDWGGVESGHGAGSGGCVFFFGKQGFQLLEFRVLFVKAVSQTTPAHIPGKDFLFCGRCQPALILNAFQQTDSGSIGGILLAGGAIAQFQVSDAEIDALFLWNLRVQRLKGDALPLGFWLGRNGSGRLLCGFGICHYLLDKGVVLQCLRVNQLAVDDTPLCQILPDLFRVNIIKGIFQSCLIPFLCMGDHGIKVQIGKVLVQFLQAVAGNLVDGFFVHLIHQPKSREVCKDFYSVLTVRGGTIRKVYMGKVRTVRVLPEYLLTVGINQVFCLIQKCPLCWLVFLYWNSFGEFRQRSEGMIPAKNREGASLIRLHCLHATPPLLIEAVTRQGCVPQGEHHGFVDFSYPLRVC